MSLAIFTDFDGTITEEDTLVMVLDQFALKPWRHIEDLVTEKKLSEKEGLKAEFDLIDGSMNEILQYIKDNVKIDPTFPAFAHWCRMENIPLIVLSGGFKLFIKETFKKFSINHDIRIYANSVKVTDDKWKIIPSSLPKINDLCNHCKTHHLIEAKKDENTVVYVGNGNTDRCPAEQADIIFAKDQLADYLTQQQIPYHRFTTFSEIKSELQKHK